MALLEADQTDQALSAARRRAILSTMSVAVIVVIGMQAAINLAVPGLASGRLRLSSSALVWLVDAYTIVFASLLIPGGAAGDRFGRRRVLCAGLGMFVAGCVVCAVATDVPIFLAGRALTGLERLRRWRCCSSGCSACSMSTPNFSSRPRATASC
jgi:MFS family permease